MPATEQTWRDQKRLHVIFAICGVIMLLATIWMFAADHDREWKTYQRDANRIEIRMTDWRKLQFETNEAVQLHRGLIERLEETQRQPISKALLEEFKAALAAHDSTANPALSSTNAYLDSQQDTGGDPESVRNDILLELRAIIADAKFREDTLLGRRKFKAADRDAAVAALGLLVTNDKPGQQAQQERVDVLKQELDELTRLYQQAGDHRQELESIVNRITQEEDLALESVEKNQTDLLQLQSANNERRSTYFNWVGGVMPIPGKKWLELPILDAFNSPRKIDNLWSEGLEIDYNFSKVRRFDRCTTCHQLMQKTLPGSADQAAYPQQRLVDLVLQPPDETSEPSSGTAEESTDESEGASDNAEETSPEEGSQDDQQQDNSIVVQLERLLGLRLAHEGLLNRTDVTVQYVRPESPAATAVPYIDELERTPMTATEIRLALMQPGSHEFGEGRERAGFQVGDTIVEINKDGNRVYQPEQTMFRLLTAAETGESLVVTVRRGMPSPFASHPRLDLFVGSLSPHKMSEFACTICHEGQGSATAFKWASHFPNTMSQRRDWRRDYGWFDNHHWIYPMYPKRFAESSCLKCHHEVTELEPSERFPEPPAPKVVGGYHLLRKYGCFGCHEINGYDGEDRVGPDMRLEPNIFAAALQLKADPAFDQLSSEARDWAEQLIQHPQRDMVRRRLFEVLNTDALSDAPKFTADTHAHITPLLKDAENPGTLRKVGPSLRFVKHKLSQEISGEQDRVVQRQFEFLADWIREPKHFRPTTRMPQFFGHWSHLDEESRNKAERFERLESFGLATFLISKSQPFEYLQPPPEAAPPSADRGRLLFEERGCLACHQHKDFPDTAAYRDPETIVQGPDLSGIGDKLDHQPGDTTGRDWLYSWIKEPTRYHARTVMPDLGLDLIEDAEGRVTDPVNDIVEYLLASSRTGWEPAAEALTRETQVNDEDLDELVLIHLKDAFSEAAAIQYSQTGIPRSMSEDLQGAERELLKKSADPAYHDTPLTREQKLNYIGGKSVAKYGCYACHDIPGYEDSKPIGTGLADWGRKDPTKLAFEHILNYLGHGHGEHSDAPGGHSNGGHSNGGHDETEQGSSSDDHVAGVDDAFDEYFHEQIVGHHRSGFIYQKLREPRSYDYHKTQNKKFNEWLRMPQFSLTEEDREAVITFVLGLVADPPSEKYVYQPDERRRALVEGQQVLDKYNCAGCHLLQAQRWSIAYQPGSIGSQPEPAKKPFPFLKTHFSPETLALSSQDDDSGLVHTTVSGMPTLEDTATVLVYDDEGELLEEGEQYDPTQLEYPFDLWEPAALDGSVYEVGVAPLNLLSSNVTAKSKIGGGFLANYLLPRVVERERQVNPNAKGGEAWGWLPPPLIGEGQKVQTSWLHDFLLNPYPIRPAVVLRMPKFNMSPEEASKLVNYFAAVDNADYPYDFTDRRQPQHLEAAEDAYRANGGESSSAESPEGQQRLHDAMNIVVDTNYCVQCHLVGDFEPKGADVAKAPNLAHVYRRLRQEYVRDWVANPKMILPYTSMPVNIPYDASAPHLGGVDQKLFHGTSVEQIDALVDLLMNYDEYTRGRSLIAPLVKELPPAAGQQPTGSEE